MVIVDSSVWIDLLNRKATPETAWLLSERHNQPIGLTSLTLAEVLQGIRADRHFRVAQEQFQSMPVFQSVTSALAIQSARNYRALRSLGVTVRGTVDCLLATFCIEYGHRLLHCDADFVPFERELGLKVVHP
ncbi:MAG TPA: PIN domain nuclease [Terracidiphilus sp.]|nr:PIN domain nuclease [Terracidiphilus sp.]